MILSPSKSKTKDYIEVLHNQLLCLYDYEPVLKACFKIDALKPQRSQSCIHAFSEYAWSKIKRQDLILVCFALKTKTL